MVRRLRRRRRAIFAQPSGDLDPLPVATIVAKITAPILRAVEVSAPAMEEKVSRRLFAILDYAVELGALVENPLPQRRRPKRKRKIDLDRKAVLFAARISEGILRDMDGNASAPRLLSRHALQVETSERMRDRGKRPVIAS